MSAADHPYTTQLQAGLGLFDETRTLLDLWHPGMSGNELKLAALSSGHFPTMTARRLRNIVIESFAPRYLIDDGLPALLLKRLQTALAPVALRQLMLVYTSRASAILADFIRTVYWPAYAAGAPVIDNESARAFIQRGIDDGKTESRWSEGTVKRVARYLTNCCSDFGLLEPGARSRRRVLSLRIAPETFVVLAHDLRFRGVPDNALLGHPDWAIFGLERPDVLDEFKRLALRNLWIVQSAGDSVRVEWKHQNMETLCDVLAQS